MTDAPLSALPRAPKLSDPDFDTHVDAMLARRPNAPAVDGDKHVKRAQRARFAAVRAEHVDGGVGELLLDGAMAAAPGRAGAAVAAVGAIAVDTTTASGIIRSLKSVREALTALNAVMPALRDGDVKATNSELTTIYDIFWDAYDLCDQGTDKLDEFVD